MLDSTNTKVILKNAQSTSNVEYAGGDELWALEKYLINYNQSLIYKLTKNQKESQSVLEFGAGIGTLAMLWSKATGIKPECLEIDPKQQSIIRERGFYCHESIATIDKKFDVIYTSNVLEHIEDDLLALKELNSKLKKDGAIVIYVPAFQMLYSEFDKKIGHYRRYEKQDLLQKLNRAGFVVDSAYFSDSIGFFAWLYMKIKGYSDKKSTSKSMRFYDKFIFPLSEIFDDIGLKYLFGKNILIYAKKSNLINHD
jgi:ubiquinone/menaquinone biosynthesis C-methylase UbiE